MFKIEYTNGEIENEPGPNLYLMGNQEDYKALKEMIGQLTTGEASEFSLSDLKNFDRSASNCDLTFSVKVNANSLARKNGDVISMALDIEYWTKIKEALSGLINRQAHYYVEFDNQVLEEEMNLIWSSEW